MKRFLAALSIPVCALVALAAAPAVGQPVDLKRLVERVERLEREVRLPRRAGATGAEVRLNEFEALLRGLERRIETLENQSRRGAERVERLAADLELRLQALERGAQASAAAGDSGAGSAAIVGGTTTPDAPPRPLGTLKAGSAAAAVLPAGTARQQYDHALALTLKEADYARAGAAFHAFIERHPDHKLTGNAYYWLGRTYLLRKDYQAASIAFADGYRKFPRGPKAPDSLYNLGLSQRQLGRKREACTVLARLLEEFPKAGPTLKKRVSRQQKRLKCG